MLPKLFLPTVRKNCSSDPEKLLKFEAEGRGLRNVLRSLEQFIQTVKGQNNYWYSNVPNKRACTFISGKVCLITLVEPTLLMFTDKRQTNKCLKVLFLQSDE